MKKTIYITLLICCILFLFGCSTTFNNKEYDGILNKNNYFECEVKIERYNVLNATQQEQYFYGKDTEIAVIFPTLELLNKFRSIPLTEVNNLDNYPTPFVVFKDNTNILHENNFFEEVKPEDKVKVWLCTYRDNNNYYNYLAGIEASCKVYLTLDQGLNGIKIYLDNHKSPFFK